MKWETRLDVYRGIDVACFPVGSMRRERGVSRPLRVLVVCAVSSMLVTVGGIVLASPSIGASKDSQRRGSVARIVRRGDRCVQCKLWR